jgi:hypothetical protein
MLKMAKLNSEKRKKSLFYKEKSLVDLTPGSDYYALLSEKYL